ncbi:MAG: RNA polymerase-binding protein DksA [Gammaproteobacteria bacterium]|nr:RNA polymerase-binding protein DksA [Gammaproteobacteria bacterium]
MAKRKPTKKSKTKRKVTAKKKRSPARKKVSKKKVTRKTKARKVTKKTAARKKATKKRVAKKKVAKKKVAKRKATKKKVAKKKVAKKTAAKKKAAKKVTKKTVAKKALAKKVAKKKVARKKAKLRVVASRRPEQPTKKSSRSLTATKSALASHYMKKSELAHFRDVLVARRQALMDGVDRTVDHMKDEAGNYPDPSDRATQESEFSLELRTRDRERKLINKINGAISSIDAGEYGYCSSCSVEIGVERLELRPIARLCIDCKQEHEIRERQTAG